MPPHGHADAGMDNLRLLALASTQVEEEATEKAALTKSVSAPLMGQRPRLVGSTVPSSMQSSSQASSSFGSGTGSTGKGSPDKVWRPF